MNKAPAIFLKAYRTFNALSLDVAIGACISSLFIASLLHVTLEFTALLSLGLSVWLIYTADHLMDARRISHPSHTFRHHFHQKNFNLILKGIVFVGSMQFFLLFFLPITTLFWGVGLLLGVVIYFIVLWLFRYYKVYHKELLIAFIYTCGIFLPPLSINNGETSLFTWLIFCQFFLLALTNLLIFSLLDVASDQKDRQASLATVLGYGHTKKIIWFLLLTGILVALVTCLKTLSPEMQAAQLILLLMNIVLGLILLFPSWQKKDIYRIVGDAIFYVPLIYLLFFR